ncbi:MAG: VOC family protein [Nocardioidaceae bacterium]|nr:VOC family protein [Nocardioidaceae bacterium]MCL2612453.1 VOC family protein [Nocardioidaceae bacterium]
MTDERPFEISGFCHLALVCSDMQETVDFYQGVLGLPLVKTVELPEGGGQHFFFEVAPGSYLAFFWFPDAPPPAPGIASAADMPGNGSILSAVGSMNHVAFSIPEDRFEDYKRRLEDAGVRTGLILNHDDSPWTVAAKMHPGVYIRSLYFVGPDGVLLELAAWTREIGPDEAGLTPRTAADLRAKAEA